MQRLTKMHTCRFQSKQFYVVLKKATVFFLTKTSAKVIMRRSSTQTSSILFETNAFSSSLFSTKNKGILWGHTAWLHLFVWGDEMSAICINWWQTKNFINGKKDIALFLAQQIICYHLPAVWKRNPITNDKYHQTLQKYLICYFYAYTKF